MIALVRTAEGVFQVDVETEVVFGEVDDAVDHERLELELPRVVAASAAGATVIAVVDRRPPLVVSYDAGATWSEAGGGLPPGFDVAVDSADPDRILFAARNRLYLSTDGGRFWRSLAPELPGRGGGAQSLSGRTATYGTLNSPRATVTAEPPTSTDSIASPEPVARA